MAFGFFVIVFVLLINLNQFALASRDALIQEYFHQGYPYTLILCFLYFVNGISLSLRQLKRILKRMGLRRRISALTRTRERQLERTIRVRLDHKLTILIRL